MAYVIWGIIIIVLVIVISGLRIIKQYEKAVRLRFGKYVDTLTPGLKWVIPFGIDQLHYRDLRLMSFDLEPQDIITKDTVSVEVNAVVFYKVSDPELAVLKVEQYEKVTRERAQTELRAKVSNMALEEVLTKRDEIGETLQKILDKATDEFGVKVTAVQIKDVILPKDMKRAMAREAEAEREKRARIIKANAEKEATKIMEEAGERIAKNSAILELRRLQTLQEIGAENNSTVIAMIPTELATNIGKLMKKKE